MLKLNKINPLLLSKDQKILAVILMFFAVIFCLLSLINHANLRTSALDLGVYTNALYDYRNFQFNDSLLFKPEAENLFADHFDFYLPVFSFLTSVRFQILIRSPINAQILGESMMDWRANSNVFNEKDEIL